MNPTAIFSNTGKGVQEASGRTSQLSRGDRTVLAAIDGKTPLGEVQKKFDKLAGPKFEALIQQLDKDGYVRQVSSGLSAAAAPPARSATPAKAPPPSLVDVSDDDMDFTQPIKLPPKAPPVDLAAVARADAEREAKEQQAFDYLARQVVESKAKADAEVKAKAEATLKAQAMARAEADARTLAVAEAKVKAAREAAIRMATEAKAKAEAEGKAKTDAAEGREREALEKARREAEDKARLEAELTGKLQQERRAREDAERRASVAADQARKEMEEKAQRDADDLRQRLEAEMQAKLEEERKARAAEDRQRAEEDRQRREEDERRRKDEEVRLAKEAEERRAREEEGRQRLEAEMKAKLEEERKARAVEDRKCAEEDRQRREEEGRQRAEEDSQRPEEAEAKAKEQAEAKARAAQVASAAAATPSSQPPVVSPSPASSLDDSLLADLDSFGRREEEERSANLEAEQRAREEEDRQKQVEAGRQVSQRAVTGKGAGKNDDDIGVTDADLDMDDIKKDQKALSATARKAAREQAPLAVAAVRRLGKWGKPAALALFVLLLGGVGVLHVMPLSTAEYEKAAADAMGVPVKIASARLSVITGIEVTLAGVAIGETVKIRTVRATPELGSLFGTRKFFNRIELEGLSLLQSQLADAVLGKVSGENFRVSRIVIKQAKLEGTLLVPTLDGEATISGDGSLQSLALRGDDKLSVRLSPKGKEIGFEISADSLALPFVPALSLSDFSMKGTANRSGVTMSEFDGRAFDGVISGSAKIRWGTSWLIDGELRARAVKVAVIAPALVSEGLVGGRGVYTMNGPNPATLFESARIEGEFKIDKGVLGSFDLTRALQTGGAQSGGRTIFTELTGRAVYDKGTFKVSNVAITAGAMNAGASLEVDANGAQLGRIVVDVKTPNQTLRAGLNLSGRIQNPVIRK